MTGYGPQEVVREAEMLDYIDNARRYTGNETKV
jgi:hypothetical protein